MKSACEKFSDYLELLSKKAHEYEEEYGEKFYEHPGEILQTFDELHQSSRENTGDKCSCKYPERKIYMVEAYSYDELYTMYVSEDLDKTMQVAKELVKNKSKKRRLWFKVVETEFEKTYSAGITSEEPKNIWDEHDDLEPPYEC